MWRLLLYNFASFTDVLLFTSVTEGNWEAVIAETVFTICYYIVRNKSEGTVVSTFVKLFIQLEKNIGLRSAKRFQYQFLQMSRLVLVIIEPGKWCWPVFINPQTHLCWEDQTWWSLFLWIIDPQPPVSQFARRSAQSQRAATLCAASYGLLCKFRAETDQFKSYNFLQQNIDSWFWCSQDYEIWMKINTFK